MVARLFAGKEGWCRVGSLRQTAGSVLLSCVLLAALFWRPPRVTPVLRTNKMVLGAALDQGSVAGGGEHTLPFLRTAAAAQPECELDVGGGPLADACQRLDDVCVDQQSAILYGEQYQKPGASLPTLDPPKRHRHYIFHHHGTVSGRAACVDSQARAHRLPDMRASLPEQGEKDYHYGLPSIHVRPASADEAAPYLALPLFSSCTVPIVYYSHYMQNVAHMFRGERRGAARCRSCPALPLPPSPWQLRGCPSPPRCHLVPGR